MSDKVIKVVHVFPEDDEAGREMHMRYWYGTVRPHPEFPEDDEDGESPVVCWCGGRHVPLKDNVVGVWHIQSWHHRGF